MHHYNEYIASQLGLDQVKTKNKNPINFFLNFSLRELKSLTVAEPEEDRGGNGQKCWCCCSSSSSSVYGLIFEQVSALKILILNKNRVLMPAATLPFCRFFMPHFLQEKGRKMKPNKTSQARAAQQRHAGTEAMRSDSLG